MLRRSNSRLSRRSLLQAGGIGLAGAAGAVMVGCGDDDDDAPGGTNASPGTQPQASATPALGGTLRLPVLAEPPHLDPSLSYNATIHRTSALIYNRLVRWNWGPGVNPASTDVVGDLAASWETPNDTTYVFKLNPGIKFQAKAPVNGRALTGDDIKATFERILDPANKSQLAGRFAGEVDSIEVPSPDLVRFNLKQPYAEFMNALAFHFHWILPTELFSGDQLQTNPVGTGPFEFESYQKGDRVSFKRNPTYWKTGKPYLDKVEEALITDAGARTARFAAGQLDYLEVDSETLAAVKRQVDDAQSTEYASWVSRRLQITPNKAPLNDPRFRLAIRHLINQQQLIDVVWRGGKVAANLPWQWGGFGLPEAECNTLLKPNIAEAKKLISASGYDGRAIELSWNQGYGVAYESAAQIVQQQLKLGGIETRIVSYPQAEFLARWRPPWDKNELLVGPLTGNSPDLLYTAYHPKGEYYFQEVTDQKLIDMVVQQRRILNVQERERYVHDIQRYLLNENVIDVPLGLPSSYVVTSPRVQNFGFHQTFGWPFAEEAWLRPG